MYFQYSCNAVNMYWYMKIIMLPYFVTFNLRTRYVIHIYAMYEPLFADIVQYWSVGSSMWTLHCARIYLCTVRVIYAVYMQDTMLLCDPVLRCCYVISHQLLNDTNTSSHVCGMRTNSHSAELLSVTGKFCNGYNYI